MGINVDKLGDETRNIIQKIEEDMQRDMHMSVLKTILVILLIIVSIALLTYNIYTLFVLL